MAEEAVRTKDEFLATLSHEIRTPLNAVVGWTKILQTRESDAALTRRGLEVIERNATVQMHLIDDMLDMARIMSGKLRLDLHPVAPKDVVRAAFDVIGPAARASRIGLDLEVEAGERKIAADADRLQQVVWNLLSNAVKFTEPGGAIRGGWPPTATGCGSAARPATRAGRRLPRAPGQAGNARRDGEHDQAGGIGGRPREARRPALGGQALRRGPGRSSQGSRRPAARALYLPCLRSSGSAGLPSSHLPLG